jgi:hypothetical protein
MGNEKRDEPTEHSEAITPAPEPTWAVEGPADEETAKYATTQAVHVDQETSNRLFWTINKRILLVMLGVRYFSKVECINTNPCCVDLLLSIP